MKRISFTVAIVFSLLMLLNIGVYAADGIMPVSELKAGMKAIGKTVISGTKIEEFNVEILGILNEQGQVGDLILVKVSGPLIDKTGGIAAGMSGSPVYVDGKLIGAVGYGWGLTDHRLGLVTPIETMLRVLELDKQSGEETAPIKLDYERLRPGVKKPRTSQAEQQSQIALTTPLLLGTQIYTGIDFYPSYAEAEAAKVPGILNAYPVKTPLLVSGITGRALERLKKDLKPFDLVPVEAGGMSQNAEKVELEPGSAIAVQLVRGDINVTAIGTLTYRDGDSVLAFGHPFTKRGKVQYYLSGAEILTVIDSIDTPFKLGVAGTPQGIITQDRNAAIGGKLNTMPTVIPVTVVVHDLDLDAEREIEFQVVRDEEMIVSLVIDAVLQSIDTAIDRQGYGTAKFDFQIIGDRLPDNLIEYSNMYYSGNDIAARVLNDFYNILDVIVNNPFELVNVGSIKVDVEVARKRQVAVIEEVKLLNEELHPGDTAQVEVTLRPYRGAPFKQVFEVQIPEDIEPGEASLTVSSGAYGSYTDSEDVEGEEAGLQEGSSVVGEYYKSIQEYLEDYLNQPRNNELLIDITPYYSESDEPEENEEYDAKAHEPVKVSTDNQVQRRGSATAEADDEESTNAQEIFQTDYVLEGSLTLEVNIISLEEGDSTKDSDEDSSDGIPQIIKRKNTK